ncbi:hypothetical protein [Amycolatopsis sp. GM8]|uniref:hypothetical protein n=1 Tax=Amycolatopsis sp. GM8 TaxID=2896530 RepID=UPI0035ABECA5
MLSPNHPLALISILGIWRAGYTWVPLNAANPLADNRNLMRRFGCSAVLFDSRCAADVAWNCPRSRYGSASTTPLRTVPR